MGTDIHLAVEVRKNGIWQRAEQKIPNKYYGEYEGGPELTYENWFHSRNYDVFAILADVRNGSGFAGVITGEGFLPILTSRGERFPARGVPDDISAEAREALSNEHTPSWVALSELLEYNWFGQTTRKRGVFDDRDNVAYQEGGKVAWIEDCIRSYGRPPSNAMYCGGISGPGVRVRQLDGSITIGRSEKFEDNRFAADYGQKTPVATEDKTFTHAVLEWNETYAEAVGGSWFEFMFRLVALAHNEHVNHDDVRIVFDFDS